MLGESRQTGWIRFTRLSKEWEPYSKTYFLDHHRIIDRRVFLSKFKGQHDVDPEKRGGDLILLSPDNAILFVSRATKKLSNGVKKWLIKKLHRKRIEVKELKTIWKYAQLLESVAEKEYFKEAILKINLQKLVPQKWIGKYRGDFVIADTFLIMIKGWEFHSRKERTLKDAKRERYIQKKRYHCITFWAEEVFLNPEGCVNETIEIINANSGLLKNIIK